ncbi:MAG: hypothetical protein IJH53_08615 [Oscillospiraceae bacterium]|nr:hypothetical protein [Oscillospiraceae bacterium]
MKDAVINRIVIIVFLLLCLIPSLGMLIFGQSEAAANEVLSQFPAIRENNGKMNKDYLSEIADWAGDRFAFRQELVTAWSGLNASLFRTSVEDKVVIGRNGWLYYSESLDDYMGLGLEDEKLEAVARNLSLMQEYAESKGADFVFSIAPNKNSLYPEAMPAYVPRSDGSGNAGKLVPFMERYGIRYADLFSAFSDENRVLYFKTDSHWDSEGAALAADVILTGLGRDGSFSSSGFTDGEEHTGDLYEMLCPVGKYTETDRRYVPGFSFTTAKDPNGGNAISIESSCGAGNGRLLCWRDSFGVSLYPYLAESFRDARFSRSASYELVRLEQEETDAVVIEIVERNIAYLLEYMPVYPAPVRDLPARTSEMPALTVSAEKGRTAASSDMTLLQCVIPAESVQGLTRAYFVCDGVCYEAAILYPEGSAPVVSAWIPSGETGSIAVVYGNESVMCFSNAA